MHSPRDADAEHDVDAVVGQERDRRKVSVCEQCRVVDAGRVLRALRVLAVAQRGGVLDRKRNVGDVCGNFAAKQRSNCSTQWNAYAFALEERCVVILHDTAVVWSI